MFSQPVREHAACGSKVLSIDLTEQTQAPRPSARSVISAVVGTVVVASVAAAFANSFHYVLHWVVEELFDSSVVTEAADIPSRWVVFGSVAGTLIVAAYLGRLASRRTRDLGHAAMTAAVQDDGPPVNLVGSIVRSSGTWLAMAGLNSIGRESAIMEVGGSFGGTFAKRFGFSRSQLTAVGVGAAFTAAYHAPLASIVYLYEVIARKRDARLLPYLALGAVVSHAISIKIFHRPQIFIGAHHILSYDSLWRTAVIVVPAALASIAFMRTRSMLRHLSRSLNPWQRSVLFAVISGLVVALFPVAAGNGMEAIRGATPSAAMTLGLTLVFAKLAATATSLESGAPGGLYSPSMAIGAGASIVTLHIVEWLGVNPVGNYWDAMIPGMAIAIAVATNAPFTAIALVTELTADVSVLPVVAVAVALGIAIERRITAQKLPTLALRIPRRRAGATPGHQHSESV